LDSVPMIKLMTEQIPIETEAPIVAQEEAMADA
jgi:hypothetical protein